MRHPTSRPFSSAPAKFKIKSLQFLLKLLRMLASLQQLPESSAKDSFLFSCYLSFLSHLIEDQTPDIHSLKKFIFSPLLVGSSVKTRYVKGKHRKPFSTTQGAEKKCRPIEATSPPNDLQFSHIS